MDSDGTVTISKVRRPELVTLGYILVTDGPGAQIHPESARLMGLDPSKLVAVTLSDS